MGHRMRRGRPGRQLGLRVYGSAGILVLAKELGRVSSIRLILDEIVEIAPQQFLGKSCGKREHHGAEAEAAQEQTAGVAS